MTRADIQKSETTPEWLQGHYQTNALFADMTSL